VLQAQLGSPITSLRGKRRPHLPHGELIGEPSWAWTTQLGLYTYDTHVRTHTHAHTHTRWLLGSWQRACSPAGCAQAGACQGLQNTLSLSLTLTHTYIHTHTCWLQGSWQGLRQCARPPAGCAQAGSCQGSQGPGGRHSTAPDLLR
jgi:hypothetical protein